MCRLVVGAMAVILSATGPPEPIAADVSVWLRYVEYDAGSGDARQLRKKSFRTVASLRLETQLGRRLVGEATIGGRALTVSGLLRATDKREWIECEIDASFRVSNDEYSVRTKVRVEKGKEILLAGSANKAAFVLVIDDQQPAR